jgi:PAN domain
VRLLSWALRELKTSDSEECQKACDEQSACLGYSLNRDAKICSLKSSVTAQRLDITYTSLLKKGPRPPELSSAKTMELHQNISTGDAESAYLVAVDSSAEDCQRLCMTEDQCISFGFGADKRFCYLMHNVGELTNNRNFISGIKRQPKP